MHVEMQQETDNMKKELAEIKTQNEALRNDFAVLVTNLMTKMQPGETVELDCSQMKCIHRAPPGALQRFVTESRNNKNTK
jgi:hypothetical protein